MFKGIVFFIKNGWKYDKLYIIWRLLFQFINSLIPIVAVIIPKYMIDELMGDQNVSKLVLYVAVLAGYTLIATCLSNYWNWDAFSRRCRVSAEFDSDLHRRLAEADFERLEDPHFLDMQEKAKKFLYCDWHGFGYLLDCAMTIIGQCFTLIGISAVIITLDWRIIAIFIISLILSTRLEGIQKKKAMRLSQKISRDQRGWRYYSELFEDFSYGKEIRMNSIGEWLLSRLNSFLDTEMEQVLCFDTVVDAERFCQEKSAFFVVMPEENPNAYFMISLLIQQLYREILSVADENGGKLPNRVMFYCDEFGTMPPIQSAEMMYSASRSRRLSIVSIIQSYQQLEKNYGREGAAIIQDNCQITIAGGFAPTSETADIVSKTLGSRTVLTGSVSRSKNDPSQSLQMTERPLMSSDELKNMKKGSFIVMKTGTHPFVSPLKLFFKWGISFSDTPYMVAEHGARKVCYVSRAKIIQAITSQFPQAKNPQPKTEPNNGGPDMTERQPKVPATVRTG